MKTGKLITLAIGLAVFSQLTQAEWKPTRRITWTLGRSRIPAIAAHSTGYIHVAWADDTPGNFEIYYKKSTDWGGTWMEAKRLSWTSGDSISPSMTADGAGRIHVVWDDYTPANIGKYYRRSTDWGTTWSEVKVLSKPGHYALGGNIIFDTSSHLHVAWSDDDGVKRDIYYTKSTDAGGTWSTSRVIASTPGRSFAPELAADGSGCLFAFWDDDTPGDFDLYNTKSTDWGASWTWPKRITWNSGDSTYPSIAVDPSGYLHVVWSDEAPGNMNIFYRKSSDAGVSWTAIRRLTWTASGSYDPSIKADSWGYLHVIYVNDLDRYEIFYKESMDGGANWMPNKRLTWGSRDSFNPALAIDSSNSLHVVWAYGDSSFPEEIYYKCYEFVPEQ